jgi:hypothetical protein
MFLKIFLDKILKQYFVRVSDTVLTAVEHLFHLLVPSVLTVRLIY